MRIGTEQDNYHHETWRNTGRLSLLLGSLFVLSQLLGAQFNAQSPEATVAPIRLHPDNPHYFLFRGKPAVLINSGEHYGAVLNPDFDYLAYLNTLQAKGFNLTRILNGTAREEIFWAGEQNTLSPRPGRYLAPWARSAMPGYRGGGNKFDLDKWDGAYFERLKNFVREAGRRGIVVELCFFTVDTQWAGSLFQATNNVNGIGSTYSGLFNTLLDPPLVDKAESLIRKTVIELNEFDNLYYEICNECYRSGHGAYSDAWQNHLVATLVEAESKLPNKHMIAWNYASFSAEVVNPNPAVSVFNFHFAFPPTAALTSNYKLNKAIAFDKTIEGTLARDRRREAWAFILSGGAVYNNLDWSFARDDPTGSGKVEQPGGRYNGEEIRSQLKILKDFIHSFDFIRMRPHNAVVSGLPAGATAYALVDPGAAYAIYLMDGAQATLSLDVEAGRYRAEWVNPRTGATDKTQELNHTGGKLTLSSPAYVEDIALRLVRITGRTG